jgi:hypothetical protein
MGAASGCGPHVSPDSGYQALWYRGHSRVLRSHRLGTMVSLSDGVARPSGRGAVIRATLDILRGGRAHQFRRNGDRAFHDSTQRRSAVGRPGHGATAAHTHVTHRCTGLADLAAQTRSDFRQGELDEPLGGSATRTATVRAFVSLLSTASYSSAIVGDRDTALTLLAEAAQARWRAVNAPHLVALVRAGARFEHGKLVEREPDPVTQEAASRSSSTGPDDCSCAPPHVAQR